MRWKQTVGKFGVILGIALSLSACNKGADKAKYNTYLEKLDQQTISDRSAPDFSGCWDAYYDMWFVKAEEETLEVPETKALDSQMERRIDLSKYMTCPTTNYVSYSAQTENLVLFSETKYQDEKSNAHHTWLKLIDLEQEQAEILFEIDSDEETIHDPTLVGNEVYWIVSADTIGEKQGNWKLYGMDLEERKAVLLRQQEGQSMMPRLQNGKDRLVWIEPDEEDVSFIVYELSGLGEAKSLFQIQNIANPYMKISYTDRILSYADYYDQSWHILIYEMDTEELYSYPVSGLEEWDYPTRVAVSRHYITYATYLNRLYTCDRETGEVKQIGNTQYELEGEQDYIVWGNQSNVILYDLSSGETTYLRKAKEDEETFALMQHTEKQFYTEVGNPESGKSELVIYNIP